MLFKSLNAPLQVFAGPGFTIGIRLVLGQWRVGHGFQRRPEIQHQRQDRMLVRCNTQFHLTAFRQVPVTGHNGAQ